MKNLKLSNQEVKGTKDWFPEEFNIRKYIFDQWRQVCRSYGFLEYLSPLLERAEIYQAKSGEDLGVKELMTFQDQKGRKLALRPEMTPSIVRMVSKIYASSPKPLKLFSIANFVRNEKPQRGRNREFWQLNCDLFGENSFLAELEILQLALDLVLVFNPPQDSFVLKINHRALIDDLLSKNKIKDSQKIEIFRLLDKKNKISSREFEKRCQDLNLNKEQIDKILKLMSTKSLNELAIKVPEISDSYAFTFLENIFNELEKNSYGSYIEFDPSVVRGLDYYDALVFEIFDKHPDNNRSMFGGGRYNGLASIFGTNNFPAIGFAPGDEPFKIFLESWKILPPDLKTRDNFYFLPLLDESLSSDIFFLAQKLRREGKMVDLGLSPCKISKALDYANKNKINQVIILGLDEKNKNKYKIKDLSLGEEETFTL